MCIAYWCKGEQEAIECGSHRTGRRSDRKRLDALTHIIEEGGGCPQEGGLLMGEEAQETNQMMATTIGALLEGGTR